MEAVTLNIDGQEVKTEKGQSVLEAALAAGIYIPSLCYHPNLSPYGGCRLCVVEIEGMRGMPTSCTTLAAEGMIVKTKTPQVRHIRRTAVELMLASHPPDCLVCTQNLNCELQAVAQYMGIDGQPFRARPRDIALNTSNPLLVHDLNKCILCGRCVRACYELRGVGIVSFIKRGREAYIGTAFDRSLADAECVFCGACAEVCPTGAIRDKDALLEEGKGREESLVPCKDACPAGIDVPRYIHLISEKKYSEATAVIREKVPFPNVLGHVCTHPCEDVCRRGEIDKAVSIKALKRFTAERDSGAWKKNFRKAPQTGKRVAVVGSGPAGLTAAFYLAKLGHSVTVFEALSLPGGMMRVGIPEYRLPGEVLDAEIEEIKRVGVDLKTNTRVESLADLFEQGYQAVFLAVGAHQGLKMGVDGEDSPGVIEAITFLREVNLGKKVKLGARIAVIGGGNVAIDAARTALRVGAGEVSLIYRRTRNEMPASDEEVDGAMEEGVKIVYLAAPNRIWSKNGKLKIECIRMELGEPDASGRRRPIPIKDSEYTADYDNIIAAIGQSPEVPGSFEVATGRKKLIEVGDDTVTNRGGVFAGGDAVSGPATVIEAIAAGRKGASAIDKYLGGSGIIDEELVALEEPQVWLGRKGDFAAQKRCSTRHRSAVKRLSGFNEVEYGYGEKTGLKESERCLKCHLRLNISPVKFPPKRGSTKGVE